MIELAEAAARPTSALRTSFATMLFKRKPVEPAPTKSDTGAKEARKRHRLSKPQTSKSSTNLAMVATQQSTNRSAVSLQSEIPMSPATSLPATGERRPSEKPRPISTVCEEGPISNTIGDDIAWHGAAVVINAAESTRTDRDSASPMPLHVPKARRPLSAMIFGSRRISNGQTASRNFSFEDAPRVGEVSTSPQTTASPVEVVIDGAPRVLERRASFTPGAATRLHKVRSREAPEQAVESVSQMRREPSDGLANANQLCEADRSYYYDEARSPISPLSQLEVLEFEMDWEPPPQVERPATPSDLDYHYLGGLRLGSLHVTNGRASPVPSELSRHLLHRPSAFLRRDASSEYGSEVGSIKRTHTPPSAWKRTQSREVSQSRSVTSSPRIQSQSNRDVSFSSENALTAHSDANGNELSSPTADRTVSMAMSYIAEMPNSPFSILSSHSNSPSTSQRASSPNGSVVVTTKKSEHEDELFEDETVGESHGSEEDRDTISTCRTPSDAASHRANRVNTDNKLRGSQSQGHLQPPQDAHGETSDSGYSSNASLQSMKEDRKSLVAQRVNVFDQPRAESAAAQLPATNQKPIDDKTLGLRPFRNSILKFHRKTAPDVVPTMASLNQSTTSLATSHATTSTNMSRPKTPSKKLQKKRRQSQPGPPEEIMVMGAQSRDKIVVPSIAEHQTANLMVRSQQFPELQRTYQSERHTKDSTGSMEQSFKSIEIRFPSPTPEAASDGKNRHHSKSPSSKRDPFAARASRRQSLERQKSLERQSSGIGEADAQALIRQFETTANSLGGSPYDIARAANSRPQSISASREGTISPPKIRVAHPPVPDRRRLTMDDRTASEFARNKSKSIAERDRQDSVENLQHDKRTALNERSGIPGKSPRPHSVQPGMLRSIPRKPLNGERPYLVSQRQHTQQQYVGPAETASQSWPEQQRQESYDAPTPHPLRRSPRPEQQQRVQRYDLPAPQGQYWSEEQQLSQPYQSTALLPPRHSPRLEQEQNSQPYQSPAPLPPRHSPRPSFVEPHDDVDEIALAPPPPSHSPRPMDLSTDEPAQDIWAAQAQAWKDRRKSVGEFLGFDSDDLHYDDEDHHSAYTDDAVVEEDLYPEIPPRESQTAYMPHQNHDSYAPCPSVWHPAAHHHAATYEPDLGRVTPAETFEDPAGNPYTYNQQEQYRQSPRPLPMPRSRRASGHSQAPSYAGSLAEELHPAKDERPAPPPDFGRYSGGMQYGYERGKGFGGSAGTRTVSGMAQGSRKSVPLSTGFGIDLSDVPIIAGIKRV